MTTDQLKRNIGIIGDGATDRKIFAKIVECILTEDTQGLMECNIIELQRQNIHDAVEKYVREKKKNLPQNPQNLVKAVVGVLYNGFIDFIAQVGELCNCDIIILTTDSEQILKMSDDYLNHGIELFHILSEAAIKFYDAVLQQNYRQNNIPLVLPIITFPSTEIIIAAAKGLNPVDYYGKKTLELKQMLYNVSDERTLSEEELQNKALHFITLKGIENIFKNIPESRDFIQTLSGYKVSCFL